jgi:hypothetical protein
LLRDSCLRRYLLRVISFALLIDIYSLRSRYSLLLAFGDIDSLRS